MNRASYVVTAMSVAVLVPILSHPAETAAGTFDQSPFFIGAGIGVARISEDTKLIDDSSVVYELFGGYEINETLSLQASVMQFDDMYEYHPFNTLTQRAVADALGVNVSLAVGFPISGRARLTGRAGILGWSMDAMDAMETSLDNSGASVSFGFGLSVRLNEELSLGVHYDIYELDELETYVSTVSLRYRF